ncbi:MAG: TrkH family potassium uptake protein [archaeon]|nr:TrkH family potassium uptake protein [archaeon]
MRYLTKKDLLIISHNLGYIFQGIGLVLLLPIIIALIYNENTYLSFVLPSLVSIGVGTILAHELKNYTNLKLKHAMIVSALAWLWASLIGAFVLSLSMHISFVNAFFENMSAWTGSGFTLFNNVEILPYSILFLRSLEQWIGGLGIIVVFAGTLIRGGTNANKLYLSEGREDKIRPSMANTIKKIFKIYLIYTIMGIIAYVIAGLPIFDSINLTFTSIATGGMSIKNANVGFYNNNLVYIITMIIMILGATSFAVHSRVIKTKGKSLLKDIQFKYLLIVTAIVTLILFIICKSVPIGIIFHVISAITTTGASILPTSEVLTWNGATLTLLFVLMLIGGSTGSTSGGIKLSKVIISFKGIAHNIKSIIAPEKRTKPLKISDKVVKDKQIKDASLFIFMHFILIAIVWFLFILYGYSPLDSLFDVISAQSNTGLSVGIITNGLPDFLKVVLIIQMWMGRLEIIPVLVLFNGIFEIFRFKPKTKKSERRKVRPKSK